MENIKPRAGGHPFSLGVRGYKEGSTSSPNIYIPPLEPNFRRGLGNYTLTRVNAFEAPEIKPRFVDFEKAQLLDLENQGIKVRFDDKSLEELLKIKIPDPTDILWIAEDRRKRANLAGRMTQEQIEEVMIRNKPLGREQRTITSTKTVGSSLVKQGELLDAINLEVQQGRATTALEQKTLLLELQNILGESKNLQTFTKQQFIDLAKTMTSLKAPKTHSQIGLPRFVDGDFVKANQGAVMMLFIGNVSSDPNYNNGIDYNTPIYNFASDKRNTGLPATTYASMITNLALKHLGKNGRPQQRFLDLHRRGAISYTQLVNEASKHPSGDGFKDTDFNINLNNIYDVDGGNSKVLPYTGP